MPGKALNNNGLLTKVYFDCNATTPVLLGAIDAAHETMQTLYGNPSSLHSVGLQAKYILESTRQIAGQVISANPEQIIFTSGATEAIQMAIFSVLKTCKDENRTAKTKLLYGATEHKVVPEALRHWVNILGLPYELVELPVDAQGQIIIKKLQEELSDAALLCTMAVNNETGAIHNLDEIEQTLINLNSDVFWLVDCVQALGKIDLQLEASRIDYAAFSGHKLYAPKGVGFLYCRKGMPITSLAAGGGQEKGHRSGTENLPGIAALGYVLKQLNDVNSDIFQPLELLHSFQEKLVSELKENFPQITFNTPLTHSVPTTINFSVPGLSSKELLDLFDQAGLYVSSGSACSASSLKTSHVLNAMGKPPEVSASAIRLSFGPSTTLEEVEQCCFILRECSAALRQAGLLESKNSVPSVNELHDGVLQLQLNGTNSWIITDSHTRRCIIIDPCQEVEKRIEQYVKCHQLKIVAILDTHSHADHESIRPQLQKRLSCYFENNEGQFNSLGWPEEHENASFSVVLANGERAPALRINTDEQEGLVLAALSAPGHTDDSQVFLLGTQKSNQLNVRDIQFVFSGDLILSGGLGRTNFPTSNAEALYCSIKKLYSVIAPHTLLCPAHDYDYSFSTNFDTEIQINPLMRLAIEGNTATDLRDFLAKKLEIDEELAELEKNFQNIICGVTNSINPFKKLNIRLHSTLLAEFLYIKSAAPLVISVLEPQEFSLFKDWGLLGFKEPPRNIPLSRLNNLVNELFHLNKLDQEILFICKSGERSFQAAQSLHRLGFSRVWNLEGGFSLLRGHYLLEPIPMLNPASSAFAVPESV